MMKLSRCLLGGLPSIAVGSASASFPICKPDCQMFFSFLNQICGKLSKVRTKKWKPFHSMSAASNFMTIFAFKLPCLKFECQVAKIWLLFSCSFCVMNKQKDKFCRYRANRLREIRQKEAEDAQASTSGVARGYIGLCAGAGAFLAPCGTMQ